MVRALDKGDGLMVRALDKGDGSNHPLVMEPSLYSQ